MPASALLSFRTRKEESHKSAGTYSEVFEFVVVLLLYVLGVDRVLPRGIVIGVEVTAIHSRLQSWDDWALLFSVVERMPVNRLEEWLRLYQSGAFQVALFYVAEALTWVHGAETTYDVFGIGRQA